jgi:hypothetical protein
MFSYKTRVFRLYCYAIFGAILGEIEVHRIGNWGHYNVLRVGWIVALGAGPSILIAARASVGNMGLASVGSALAILMLVLGILSGHSQSSLTWVGHVLLSWFYGVILALAMLGIMRLIHDRSM